MAQCKTCFTHVDGRKAIRCATCNGVLHEGCAISFGGADLCDVCFTVAEEEPKSKYGDFELPAFVRRTHIETYRSCPYKFYQEVIKGNAMPPNEYTQVGIDVHNLIEKAITDGLPYEDCMAMIDEIFEQYDDDLFQSRTKEEMYVRATESLHTFYEAVLPTLDKTVAVEETIFTNIGDNIPEIRITMDLITEKDGELEMHDWKTGRVMVGKKLSTDLQAPLYIYSVINKYKKPVRKFTFYYLQENKTRTFVRSETSPDMYICTVGKREYKIILQDAIREVKSIFSKIKKGNFDPDPSNPNRYFTQKMCHLKELGLCCQDVDPWNQI